MTSIATAPVDIVIESRQPPNAARGEQSVLAVAQLNGAAVGVRSRRIITLVAPDAQKESRVAAANCIAIDDELSAEQAFSIPTLAWSLWAWDQLSLELGDAAVYCVGSPFEHFLGEVATAQGALPILQLGQEPGKKSPEGVDVLTSGDAGVLLSELRSRLKKCVGVAAIDLSGKAEITDVLFEALPRSSRLLLAAHRGGPLTIDFYNNVHRKGMLLRSAVCDPFEIMEGRLPRSREYITRAERLLLRRGHFFGTHLRTTT